MHHKIVDVKIGGFAVTSAEAGQPVFITTKDSVTSESSLFYVYAEQFSNIIFPKTGALNLRDVVNYYLVVIHPDCTADFYAQDFEVVAKIKPNRDIKAGEAVYAKDITDISETTFPKININPDDQIIYLQRSGWRFGLYFNLSRELDMTVVGREIANLQKQLVLEDVLKKTLADLKQKEANVLSGKKPSFDAYIITEGKTDWTHLKKAFHENGYDRVLEYSQPDRELGDLGLLEICRRAIHVPPHDFPIVCIFDRDNPEIQKALLKQSGGVETEFQSWGGNVYSMMIPVPDHRVEYKNISIEMYYPDEIIRRTLSNGKRLFFDNELKREILPGGTNKWIPISAVSATENFKKVYGTNVFEIENESGIKVGLSKTAFAELISEGTSPFENINFQQFSKISDVIEKIVNVPNILK